MDRKNSPQKVIGSFRRRQQLMPFIIGGLAVLLVAIGVIILVVWFTGPNHPAISFLTSPTPTSTDTATSTPVTPTLTLTPTDTETITPTETNTITPTGPFEYTVKDQDNCWSIAQTFKVDLTVLLALNNFPPGQCPIVPSQKILIPAPGQVLPTETPIPTNIAKGTKITYYVKPGDTMFKIASQFNSTIEQILLATNDYNKKNNLPAITDQAKINVGQLLIIPVNIATATPTRAPTSTSAASKTLQPSTATQTAAK
ncbi:MAG: LysM peptidoglycan-binding domain-containing protein [Anaerolineaceae bacterium]|jgi:LysM repeat protein